MQGLSNGNYLNNAKKIFKDILHVKYYQQNNKSILNVIKKESNGKFYFIFKFNKFYS